MSNGRRPNTTRARRDAVLRSARCPDCDSHVKVVRRAGPLLQLSVEHDSTCLLGGPMGAKPSAGCAS